MTHDAITPAARDQIRAWQDDEYELSTPAAGRWRRNLTGTATSQPVVDDRGADGNTTRLAQRHRFGRALDLPPAEPWPESALIRWWFWLLAVSALAGLIAWLT